MRLASWPLGNGAPCWGSAGSYHTQLPPHTLPEAKELARELLPCEGWVRVCQKSHWGAGGRELQHLRAAWLCLHGRKPHLWSSGSPGELLFPVGFLLQTGRETLCIVPPQCGLALRSSRMRGRAGMSDRPASGRRKPGNPNLAALAGGLALRCCGARPAWFLRPSGHKGPRARVPAWPLRCGSGDSAQLRPACSGFELSL